MICLSWNQRAAFVKIMLYFLSRCTKYSSWNPENTVFPSAWNHKFQCFQTKLIWVPRCPLILKPYFGPLLSRRKDCTLCYHCFSTLLLFFLEFRKICPQIRVFNLFPVPFTLTKPLMKHHLWDADSSRHIKKSKWSLA